MALRYAALALRPQAERAAKNVEVALFVASLWSSATPSARTKYTAAVTSLDAALPWSAVTKPAQVAALPAGPGKMGALTPILRGPPVVLLILGQADPEDEGVDGYRLIAGEPRAEAILGALYEWDVPLLTRTATASGWNLDGAEEPVVDDGAEEPVDDGAELPVDDEEMQVDDAPEGDQPASPTGLTQRQKGFAAAGVAAGFGLLGFAAWRLG